MEWVASTLHTTSERGVSSITTADAHASAASSRLNWRPRRFKWTRPFRRKTKSAFCACAITFQTQSKTWNPVLKEVFWGAKLCKTIVFVKQIRWGFFLSIVAVAGWLQKPTMQFARINQRTVHNSIRGQAYRMTLCLYESIAWNNKINNTVQQIRGKNIYIYIYTECPRRNVTNFGRVFLMLNYTDITQNTYMQSWTVTEIMAGEVWNFDSCYTLIDYQIHIETVRNMWFM